MVCHVSPKRKESCWLQTSFPRTGKTEDRRCWKINKHAPISLTVDREPPPSGAQIFIQIHAWLHLTRCNPGPGWLGMQLCNYFKPGPGIMNSLACSASWNSFSLATTHSSPGETWLAAWALGFHSPSTPSTPWSCQPEPPCPSWDLRDRGAPTVFHVCIRDTCTSVTNTHTHKHTDTCTRACSYMCARTDMLQACLMSVNIDWFCPLLPLASCDSLWERDELWQQAGPDQSEMATEHKIFMCAESLLGPITGWKCPDHSSDGHRNLSGISNNIMKGCQGVHEASENDGSLNPLKSHIIYASIFEEVQTTQKSRVGREFRVHSYIPRV